MSRSAGLYACVYVREFPAQALLRFCTEKKSACVVMEGQPPFEEVCSLNTKARLMGIRQGMNRTDVDGFPQTTVLSRSFATESKVREMLLECAGTYSPRIEENSGDTYFLCVIDINGTETLFGRPEILARTLLLHVQSIGLSSRITVSNNFHTAVCLAKGSSRRAIDVVRSGEEAAALSSLPLNVLALNDEQTEIFALWGIQTLGMLADLPEKDLIARIGQDGKHLQQLARGELPHLFQPIAVPLRLEERWDLDFPLDSLDSLMFGIALMLDKLILRAKARLLALAAITISLELDDEATHTRTVKPARPGTDKQFWIRLLHLDLQSHPPQAAVVAITLKAEQGDTSKIQLGLFSPPLPEAARLDVTLAQLTALLGEDNVGYAALLDSHAPDAFRLRPFNVQSSSPQADVAQQQWTAARQLRPPEVLPSNLNDMRGGRFIYREQQFVVEHAYGPWITGGDWWNEMLWNTEQWDVLARAQNGARLCCCITRDLLLNQWQVTALYD